MANRYGKETNLTSHQVKKIYQELKRGNKKYAPNFKLCTQSGCRGGFRINNQNGKIDECPRCLGWGIIREI